MTLQTDFDRIITRRGTGSLKWDKLPELDPFWVADMDFPSPPAVLKTLQDRVAHGVLGYAKPHAGLIESLLSYMQSRHHLAIEEKEIVHLGGLVCALSLVARAFGKPGDAIMTCTPIYPPISRSASGCQHEMHRRATRLQRRPMGVRLGRHGSRSHPRN